MLLQARGRLSATVLAKDLGVSVRTVYRDVAALERSGIPVLVDRGRDGGVSLNQGYHSRLTGLSMKEVDALPFINAFTAASALELGPAARAASAKTIAALPLPARERAMSTAARFLFDPIDWYTRPANPPLLRSIADATCSDQIIAIDYESWQTRRIRVVEPLGVVCKTANWYLVARHKKRVGIYRIDSMHAVRVIAGRTVNRRNFNLEQVWNREVARFEAGLRRQRTRIRVSADAMSQISVLGADAAEAIRSATPDKHGWRTSEIWIESPAHAAKQLLCFADLIEVISPAELRRELAECANRVAAMYKRERHRS